MEGRMRTVCVWLFMLPRHYQIWELVLASESQQFLRDLAQSSVEEGKETKRWMCVGLFLERPAHKNGGHTCVTRQVDRGNRMTMLPTLSVLFCEFRYDLNAWEYTEILTQGMKMTRHWPKKEMFKSYKCFSPVYQTNPSAVPNRISSFHASILYITCTEKTTENALEVSTVHCTKEKIHFSRSPLHQCPSDLHQQPVCQSSRCCHCEHEKSVIAARYLFDVLLFIKEIIIFFPLWI